MLAGAAPTASALRLRSITIASAHASAADCCHYTLLPRLTAYTSAVFRCRGFARLHISYLRRRCRHRRPRHTHMRGLLLPRITLAWHCCHYMLGLLLAYVLIVVHVGPCVLRRPPCRTCRPRCRRHVPLGHTDVSDHALVASLSHATLYLYASAAYAKDTHLDVLILARAGCCGRRLVLAHHFDDGRGTQFSCMLWLLCTLSFDRLRNDGTGLNYVCVCVVG